jgi:hypothetical protein
MNYDLYVYSHFPYKPYKIVIIRKKNLTKQSFYAKIKVLIV